MEKGANLASAVEFFVFETPKVLMLRALAVIALLLAEAIILRNVLKPRFIATFFGIVAMGIMLVDYPFNFLM